jgi:hypothetical protein
MERGARRSVRTKLAPVARVADSRSALPVRLEPRTRQHDRKARRSQGSPEVADSREFLQRLARILVHSGHSPRRLMREFAAICKGWKEPSLKWDPGRLAFVSDLPHVIAHWHVDPQYVDSHGSPLPLPLRARGRSLITLIRRVLPSRAPSEVVESLLALRAVRRQGLRYLPTDRYLAFNEQRVSALAHGLTTLLGMLRTVEHNISCAPSARVLERASINPQFPVNALPAFHRRLKRLAADFLWSIDGDMGRQEGRNRAGPTIRLGVGVFAFEDPLVTRSDRSMPQEGATRRKNGKPRQGGPR